MTIFDWSKCSHIHHNRMMSEPRAVKGHNEVTDTLNVQYCNIECSIFQGDAVQYSKATLVPAT